jgi:PAS domain S-box-containing protein
MHDSNQEHRNNGSLQDLEDKYMRMISHADVAIVLVDPDQGNIIKVNESAAKLIGCQLADLIGIKFWSLHPADEKDLSIQFLHDVSGTGFGHITSLHFEAEGSLPISVGISASLVTLGNKRIAQLICQDISELGDLKLAIVKLEEETARSSKLAELGRLLAVMVHDINVPVAAMKSNNDLMIRVLRNLDEILANKQPQVESDEISKLKSALQNMRTVSDINKTAVEKIIQIFDTLRKLSISEKGEMEFVDLHEAIESILVLLRHELDDRVKIIRKYGDIPKVKCHPGQLSQVILNILANSVQAIEGSGTISIKTRRLDYHLELEISDSGRGIPQESRHEIFKPGFTTKHHGQGTGLGLWIVRRIVEEHKWNLELESEKARGTTLRIIIGID